MARPTKTGLDYFPYDVNPDSKTKILIRKYGFIGEGVYLNLLKRIYSQGYFLKLCDDLKEDFCIEFGIELSDFEPILKFIINKNFFSKEAFEKHDILTSNGIQKRFLEATRKRKLNNKTGIYQVNDTNNLVNDAETPLKSSFRVISTQSKVKESKVNKSKELKDLSSASDSFDIWWQRYGKKGNRLTSLQCWNKLTEQQKEMCLNVVESYVLSTPNIQFRKGGESYLRKQCWNDEILESSFSPNDKGWDLQNFQVNSSQGVLREG